MSTVSAGAGADCGGGVKPRQPALELGVELVCGGFWRLADRRPKTFALIARLKELGVRITLDDFGTGYSSAVMFPQYPSDIMKIDRSFVCRSLDGGRERAIMAAIIALAHAAGLTVVAEGVETRAQLELLRELGAEEIQGYFFSEPLPAADCEPFLRGRCDLVTGAAG